MNFQIDSFGLQNIFELLDYDKDGKINLNEVIGYIQDLGYDKEQPLIFNLMKELGDGLINYDNFEKKINNLINDPKDNNGLRRIYEIFVNNDKKKNINLNELKKICSELGRNLNKEDMDTLFKNAGNEKKITFETFVEFMKNKFS
jgi:Ca2+-binding EF-hand superfamily protein